MKNRLRKSALYGLGFLIATVGQTLYAGLPAGVSLDLITTVADNDDERRRPIAVRNAADGTNRLFIVLQNGEILIYDLDNTTLLNTAFLDIRPKVDDEGNEQGLLGLAFHPDFANNGQFYVNYTRNVGVDQPDRTVIARYTVSAGDANLADPASEQVLMEIGQDFPNHNGGNLLFGPDGYLYIGMGDGGSANDPNRHAQDLTSLLGKMLRIDVDDTTLPSPSTRLCGLNPAGYGIPADNPFLPYFADGFEDTPLAPPARPCAEIWAYGLRNPWRWSFDRQTGDLIIGDVGQNAVEEIDFEPAGSSGGLNYGWRCREGDQTLQIALDENDPACIDAPQNPFVEPILTYSHDVGISVTGGYRVRGPSITLQGIYIYADLSGLLFFADETGGVWSEEERFDTSGLVITSFGEDEAGNLYFTDIGGGVRLINIP